MGQLRNILGAVLISISLSLAMLPPAVSAVDFIGDSCTNNPGDGICPTPATGKSRDDVRTEVAVNIANIIDGLLYLMGAISIIMIVYGGFRYVISRGDSTAIQSAKNIILYAVIGLALALLAKVIVTFVVGEL